MSDSFILIFWVEGHASGRYRVLAVATGAGGHTFGAIEDALASGQARSHAIGVSDSFSFVPLVFLSGAMKCDAPHDSFRSTNRQRLFLFFWLAGYSGFRRSRPCPRYSRRQQFFWLLGLLCLAIATQLTFCHHISPVYSVAEAAACHYSGLIWEHCRDIFCGRQN